MAERTKKSKISSVLHDEIFNILNKINILIKSNILIYILCFLAARNSIANELYPFAVSFLCAYFIYKQHSIIMLAVAILGVVSAKGSLVYIFTLVFTYLYFIKIRDNENKNIVHISILISVVLFLFKIIDMIIKGFEIEVFLINSFECMLVFSSIYIINTGINILKDIGSIKNDTEKKICLCITIIISILGFKEIYILDFSILKCIEYFIIPFCACYLGPEMGALSGFIFGFINGTSVTYAAYYISALSFGGVVTGLFCSKNRLYGGVIFPIVSVTIFYYFGTTDIFKGDIKELVTGFLIYFIVVFFNDRKIKMSISKEQPNKKTDNTYKKLTKLSRAIEEVCTAYREGLQRDNLSGSSEKDEIINEVYSTNCLYCTNHDVCWKNNFNKTYYAFIKIIKNINSSKNIIANNYLKDIGCNKYNDVMKDIYKVVRKIDANILKQSEINKSKQAVVDHLLETSNIINDTAKEIKDEDIRSRRAINHIKLDLEKEQIYVNHIDISGKVEDVLIIITFDTKENLDRAVDNIVSTIFDITGMRIFCTEKVITTDTKYILKFRSRKKINANSYYSRISKGNSIVSGDSFCYGTNDDKYYIILSDGMGSGTQAQNESKSTVDILSKLTEANFNEKQLIKTMNSLLLLKFEDERYTTIDLSIVDFIEHEVRFYKAGSAPTFLIKEKEIIRINSNSLPVGILEEMDYQFNQSKIKPGDIIVMVTDGIIDSINLNEGKSFEKYLNSIRNEEPQNMANLILAYAIRGCSEIIDDMTVIVTKVKAL